MTQLFFAMSAVELIVVPVALDVCGVVDLSGDGGVAIFIRLRISLRAEVDSGLAVFSIRRFSFSFSRASFSFCHFVEIAVLVLLPISSNEIESFIFFSSGKESFLTALIFSSFVEESK